MKTTGERTWGNEGARGGFEGLVVLVARVHVQQRQVIPALENWSN